MVETWHANYHKRKTLKINARCACRSADVWQYKHMENSSSPSPILFQEINAQGYACSANLWTEAEAADILQYEKISFVQVSSSHALPKGTQMLDKWVFWKGGLGYLTPQK